jgi:hypothetical protein
MYQPTLGNLHGHQTVDDLDAKLAELTALLARLSTNANRRFSRVDLVVLDKALDDYLVLSRRLRVPTERH